MKKEIYYKFLDSFDPYLNLAFEDQLLKEIEPHQSILLLYRNNPCIVLGRFQNPWKEANIGKLGNVNLVRRQSGGGCVYHDQNNLCFSFIHGQRDHAKNLNNKILLQALKRVGIFATASNRSDLVLESDGRKFSGSAFKQKKSSSFHHGTLLFNSDLMHLNDLLNSPLKQITGKSIPSNPSKVVNLLEVNKYLTIEDFAKILKLEFEKFFEAKAQEINRPFINEEYLSFLSSWEWIIGETPYFSFQNNGFRIEALKGRIKYLELNGDNLGRVLEGRKLDHNTWCSLNMELKNRLKGQRALFF